MSTDSTDAPSVRDSPMGGSPVAGSPVAERATPETVTAPKPPTIRMAGLAGLVILGIGLLLASPWRGGFSFAYMGIVPGITAVLLSPRIAVYSAFATALAVFVGVAVGGSIPLSVLWMTLLAVGIVFASRVGWASIACMVAAQAAIVIVYGKVFAHAPEPFNQPASLAGALPVAAFALGGGLLVALAGWLFIRDFPGESEDRLSVRDSWWFGATVIPLTILATWMCLQLFPGTHSWWLLLTFYVVLLPTTRAARPRMQGRVIGTLVGAIIATALTFVIDSATVFYVLALIAAVGTLLLANRSYSLYAAFLTATVLFGGFHAADNAVLLNFERIVLTILGALAAYGALRFCEWLRERLEARPPAPAQ